jgi:O-antigen/teichoic acid export membrane protein
MENPHRTTYTLLAPLIEHTRKPLFRNAYALMLSAGVTSALGLVYWVVAARYYSSETVGRNSALLSAMTLLSGLSQLNLRSFLTRFIGRAGRGTRRLVLGTYAACSATTLLVCAIFVWNIGWWSPGLSFIATSPSLEAGFVVATLAWGIFVLQDSTLTGLRQAFWVPVENGVFAVGKLVLLVLVASSIPDYGIFVSWTIPLVLSLLPVNLLIFGRLVPNHEAATAGHSLDMTVPQVVRFVGTDYVGGLFSLVATAWLPIIVHDTVGGMMTAYFYQPWLIAASLQIVAVNLAASMTVEAAADESKVWAYARAVLRQAAMLLLPTVGVVLLGAPWILWVFGPDYAREGSTLLRLLALAVLPNVVNVLFISLARVRRQMTELITIQAALCIGALALSTFTLPRYSITGIGYAWLASQTVVACVLLVRHRRIFLRSKTA